MCYHSVQKRLFVRGTHAGRSATVPHARTILAEHRVQPGGCVGVPARLAVAPSSRCPAVGHCCGRVVSVVRTQGAVRANHHRQPVAGRRAANVIVRTAQPVVRGHVQSRGAVARPRAVGRRGHGCRRRKPITLPERRRRWRRRWRRKRSRQVFAASFDGKRFLLICLATAIHKIYYLT